MILTYYEYHDSMIVILLYDLLPNTQDFKFYYIIIMGYSVSLLIPLLE